MNLNDYIATVTRMLEGRTSSTSNRLAADLAAHLVKVYTEGGIAANVNDAGGYTVMGFTASTLRGLRLPVPTGLPTTGEYATWVESFYSFSRTTLSPEARVSWAAADALLARGFLFDELLDFLIKQADVPDVSKSLFSSRSGPQSFAGSGFFSGFSNQKAKLFLLCIKMRFSSAFASKGVLTGLQAAALFGALYATTVWVVTLEHVSNRALSASYGDPLASTSTFFAYHMWYVPSWIKNAGFLLPVIANILSDKHPLIAVGPVGEQLLNLSYASAFPAATSVAITTNQLKRQFGISSFPRKGTNINFSATLASLAASSDAASRPEMVRRILAVRQMQLGLITTALTLSGSLELGLAHLASTYAHFYYSAQDNKLAVLDQVRQATVSLLSLVLASNGNFRPETLLPIFEPTTYAKAQFSTNPAKLEEPTSVKQALETIEFTIHDTVRNFNPQTSSISTAKRIWNSSLGLTNIWKSFANQTLNQLHVNPPNPALPESSVVSRSAANNNEGTGGLSISSEGEQEAIPRLVLWSEIMAGPDFFLPRRDDDADEVFETSAHKLLDALVEIPGAVDSAQGDATVSLNLFSDALANVTSDLSTSKLNREFEVMKWLGPAWNLISNQDYANTLAAEQSFLADSVAASRKKFAASSSIGILLTKLNQSLNRLINNKLQ